MEVKIIGGKTEITRRDFNDSDINDYGRARLKYLKDHDKVLYQKLLIEGKLTKHLVDVSNQGSDMFYNNLDVFMRSDRKTSQEYKRKNQKEWVKNMNAHKKISNEIVINNVVCRDVKEIFPSKVDNR